MNAAAVAAGGAAAAAAAEAPVLALAGPTASGKTALALQLALAMAPETTFEIISVDSALVYQFMDIGSAKPTAAERAAVPHHLIDLLPPEQSYSAARFVADARACVAELRARGREPLLVGGTMLYFKALRDGLDTMPAADAALRADIEARAARLGWPALHAELAALDPAAAARLAPLDAQRIQRALEVVRSSGRPLSDFHRGGGGGLALHLLALEPTERAWLHARIAQRFDTMLAQGLLDEVRALRQRPGLHAALPSMRCVGYRQAWQALEDGRPEALTALRERGIAASRQLAKRQLTWLRSMPREVLACDAPDVADALLAAARRWRQGKAGAPRPVQTPAPHEA